MIIPNFMGKRLVDKEGNLLPGWNGYFNQLETQLQLNFSDAYYVLPQQPTSIINQLTAAQYTPAMVYDNTTQELKVNLNGTWQVVQVV